MPIASDNAGKELPKTRYKPVNRSDKPQTPADAQIFSRFRNPATRLLRIDMQTAELAVASRYDDPRKGFVKGAIFMFRAFTGLMVVGALALSAASAQAHDYDHVVRYGGDWDHRHWEHERAEHERLEQLRRQQAWREREYLEHHTYRPTLEYGVQYAPQYVPQYVPQYETFARPSCEHAATAVVVPQPIYQPGVGFSLTGRNFSLSVGR